MKKSSFGSRLLEVRRGLGVSAEQFSKSLGLHRNTVVAYEADLKEPSISIVSSLNDADIDWIYVLSGQHRDDLVSEHFDWDLLQRIWISIEAVVAKKGGAIPVEKRFAVARVIYKQAVHDERKMPSLLDDVLRVAA